MKLTARDNSSKAHTGRGSYSDDATLDVDAWQSQSSDDEMLESLLSISRGDKDNNEGGSESDLEPMIHCQETPFDDDNNYGWRESSQDADDDGSIGCVESPHPDTVDSSKGEGGSSPIGKEAIYFSEVGDMDSTDSTADDMPDSASSIILRDLDNGLNTRSDLSEIDGLLTETESLTMADHSSDHFCEEDSGRVRSGSRSRAPSRASISGSSVLLASSLPDVLATDRGGVSDCGDHDVDMSDAHLAVPSSPQDFPLDEVVDERYEWSNNGGCLPEPGMLSEI